MKLPNWFKVAWWVLLLGGLTRVLWVRYPDLVSGRSSLADICLFLVWVALFLAPLFQEVNFFGVKLKGEVRELKDELVGLRADIRNSIDVRTLISPTFNVPLPPSDAQLPVLEERIRRILGEVLREHGVQPAELPAPQEADVTDDVIYLFKVRYQIDRELRRIWGQRMETERFRRPLSVVQMASSLVNEGFIDPRVVNIIRDVNSIVAPATHGVPITAAQVAFVREVAPGLISTLKALQN